jgi:PPP family 3-phenylpropionic acid transporter
MPRSMPRIRLSSFYFVYFSILGILIPYWPLYLQEAGYDAARIGSIMAIIPATKIVSPAYWGWLADRYGKTLRLIRWASFLSWTIFLCLLGDRTGLGMLIGTMLGFSFCWNATLPLFEAVTLGHLGQQTARYSRIRLWGSVGFIAFVWLIGQLLDGELALARLPELITGLLILQWCISLAVPPAREMRHADDNASLLGILRRGEVLVFFFAALLLQVSHGPYYAFFSLYLEQLNYSDTAIGQLWALGVIAEIAVFLYLHRIRRGMTLRFLFLGSLALSVMRWLLIGWAADYLALLLLAQLLHAATFATAHASAIEIVHRHFSGPHHAKGQALYSGLCYGLGGVLGSFYSGQLWESLGPKGVFTLAAGFSLIALLAASAKMRS